MKCCACENVATKKIGPTRNFQIFNFCDKCYRKFTCKDIDPKSITSTPLVFNKQDVTSLSFEIKTQR